MSWKKKKKKKYSFFSWHITVDTTKLFFSLFFCDNKTSVIQQKLSWQFLNIGNKMLLFFYYYYSCIFLKMEELLDRAEGSLAEFTV